MASKALDDLIKKINRDPKTKRFLKKYYERTLRNPFDYAFMNYDKLERECRIHGCNPDLIFSFFQVRLQVDTPQLLNATSKILSNGDIPTKPSWTDFLKELVK